MSIVSLAVASLDALRSALLASYGADAVPRLQEAGYVTGEALYEALVAQLAAEGAPPPDQLPPDAFALRVGAFLQAQGWGTVTLAPDDEGGDPRALLVTVDGSPEARSAGGCDDGCPLTTGMLSGLLSRVVDAPVAVLAVETGGPEAPLQCRFLAASPETVQLAWQAMADGRGWREAVRAG